ncbi:mannose-1-phosphate guanylyltransferase [candidate division KSB1 bacterium]|nr:mannose-1-phosphate guanylyltransferase [candidate division KSB1 bacterium]
MEHTHAVIMAGGVGSRFWPRSRKSIPKQFLRLFEKETLIQASVGRITPLVPPERIWVVANQTHRHLLIQQLPDLPQENLLLEPIGRNTAPCIGLAALHVYERDPDAIMLILPSDHLISNPDNFCRLLRQTIDLVRENRQSLVTLGIQPTYPATGYGYIQRGTQIDRQHERAFRVRAFAEKPTLEVARQFFQSGEFLWNSGIFIWYAETILNYISELMPDLYAGLLEIRRSIKEKDCDRVTERVYQALRSQSIDYGVMESASQVLVVEGDFGWSDVGGWEETWKLSAKDDQGNAGTAERITKNSENNLIESDKLVVLIGVHDLVVVDTPDALLICNRSQSQEVKWVVEKLKHEKSEKYL